MKMRVPDPEDPKYWHEFIRYYGITPIFDEKKYIRDFRKWKAEVKKLKEDLSEISRQPAKSWGDFFIKAAVLDIIKIIDQITGLGESGEECGYDC